MIVNNPRTTLIWRWAGSRYPRSGYYCSECSKYLGQTGKGQRFCPFCHKKIVGFYA